jgi:tetratricopeptide (TPR) repeat protein
MTMAGPPKAVFLSLVAVLFPTFALSAAEPVTVNLLRLPIVKLEDSTVSGSQAAQLIRLTDGDPSSIASVAASEDAPFTVVFGFGGATVSLDQLVVTVPTDPKAAAPTATKIDLLVSTLSPHAGFQAVRTDLVQPSPAEQKFSFGQVGARWIMLRFAPAKGQRQTAIAELCIQGHEGPPVSRYSFKEAPAKAFDVLGRLQKLSSLNVSISNDEAALFADARDGKLNKWTFAEAALLASGVTDAAKRQRYLELLAQIQAEAREKVAAAKSPFEKGEALLHFLHAGPMRKGYVGGQTDLATILDTQTFNCVSSATLYNVIARQLGLDARGIEVPNHAFSILYDGTDHADVETTTAGGFNPARDPAAREQFTKLTGFAYIPDSNRDQRREVGEIGLIAITYYNHGVELSQQKRYHEALLAYFRSMSLDSEFDSAVKNALAVLANWSVELSNEKKFDQAIDVLSAGLELAPKDATLVNNHLAVWSHWGDSLIRAGKTEEALAVIDRASKAVPDGPFQRMRAWVFIQPGEEFAKTGQWEKAIALVQPGLQKLDGEPRKELDEWGQGLYLRWANDMIRQAKFEQAVTVLERGLTLRPGDPKLTQNIAYSVQEWSADVYKKEGIRKSEAVVESMLKRFPKSAEIGSVAKNQIQRSIQDLAGKAQFEEALAAADRAREWLRDPEVIGNLMHVVYDDWANSHSKRHEWKAAADVYAKGLQRFPDDGHIKNNLLATWDSWAASYQQSRNWEGGLDVYEQARKALPDKQQIEQNIAYCIQEGANQIAGDKGPAASEAFLKKQLVRFKNINGVRSVAENHVRRLVDDLASHEKYDDALAVVDRSTDLLGDARQKAELAGVLYDRWANRFSSKKEWQKAVEVYGQGLKRLPGDSHLEQNATATWYQWANGYSSAKDWPAAIRVYEQALQSLPNNSVFKQNLDYCRQQAGSK